MFREGHSGWARTITTRRKRRCTASPWAHFSVRCHERHELATTQLLLDATGYLTVAERPLDPAELPRRPR